MPVLSEWANFYVIVGSSAGALIGLQFVVITLLADMPRERGVAEASSAFVTPTIMHFSVVLTMSAAMSAPWHDTLALSATCFVLGLGGAIYAFVIGRRMVTQKAYEPEFEDWLFYVILPFSGYALLVAAALALRAYTAGSLYSVAFAVLMLLMIGIHNSWDTITHIVFVQKAKTENESSGKLKEK